MEKKRGGTIFTLPFVMLMVVSFFISGSFYLVNTSLSSYAVSMGASLTMAGVIVGCFSITSLVVRPFSGVLVNRMAKKKVLLLACGFMFVASLAYVMVGRPELLIAVRVLHGIGFALNGTVSLVLVSYTVPEEKMSQSIAYFGLAQMLASAVMPSVGAWVAGRWGGQMVFYVTAGIVVLGSLILTCLPIEEPGVTEKKSKGVTFGELICVQLLPLAALGGLFSMFNGINSSFMLQIGAERGIANIAVYFTVNTAAIIAIRVLLTRWADRNSIYHVLIPASVSAVLAAVCIGGAASLAVIVVAAVFQAAGQGMAQPGIQAECIRRMTPERRGTASSTYFMCSDIGQGMGTMVAGAASDALGYGATYYGIAVIFFLGALACWAAAAREKGKVAKACQK